MLWLDEKYIGFISNRLLRFKRVKSHQYVFRCPICGDSKKNPWKTRGGLYVHPSSQDYNMGCFNCSASMKFSAFLKLIDENLYNEYLIEKFKEEGSSSSASAKQHHITESTPKKRFSVGQLDSISSLDSSHPVIKYLTDRMIPESRFDILFYAPSYKRFIESLDPSIEVESVKKDHPRLIIPFFDKRGNVSRLSARSFSPKENPKYLYTKIDPEAKRLYGLDRVDASKEVLVLEGPLDSLFFDNAVAIGSADYSMSEIDVYENKIIVPDNEPRNRDVCSSIMKAINKGSRVCLWNEYWGKDINEMIENQHSVEEIHELIQYSTVQGLEAMMKFSKWKR